MPLRISERVRTLGIQAEAALGEQFARIDAIAAEINRFEEVKAVYLMSGTYDLTVMLESKSIRDISLFVSERLSTIDSVIGMATHFIMKKYKEGGVILESEEQKDRLAVHA